MKELLISNDIPPSIGGAGAHTYYLAEILKESNFFSEIYILSGRKDNSIPYFEEKGKLKIIRDTELFKYFTGQKELENITKRANNYIKEIRPDIIHSQHIKESMLGLYLKDKFNVPLLVSLHKTPPTLETSLNETEWKTCKQILNGNYDRFIATSETFKRFFAGFGVDQEKLELVYSAIPSNRFKRSNDDTFKRSLCPAGNELIIYPTRLDRRKGIEVFIKSIPLVNKKTTKKLTFLVTGTDESNLESRMKLKTEYKRQLLTLSSSLGIDNLILSSKVEYQDMPNLYAASDLCVYHTYGEGLGISILEALSSGTPTISTNVNGVTEIIENDYNGLLVKPGDEKELADAILRLIENKELGQCFAKNSENVLRTKFNEEKVREKYVGICKKIL